MVTVVNRHGESVVVVLGLWVQSVVVVNVWLVGEVIGCRTSYKEQETENTIHHSLLTEY